MYCRSRDLLRRIAILAILVSGCASHPPPKSSLSAPSVPFDLDNLCVVFAHHPDWYSKSRQAEARWGLPLPVLMAFIRQESSFRADARPRAVSILGVFSWGSTSAYGYAQAKDDTWKWYQQKTGHANARRDQWGDAADFVGWYAKMTRDLLGIPLTDAYRQYLAYHEGHGGYSRGTYKDKDKGWLLDFAHKVEERARQYGEQLRYCER
ncbi:MAG: transglycosylase SLT domain-containing protein [Pseudomonadota bacterium]